EATDPEFVEKYSDIANNALALISDLIFNYQQSRVLPLEGEIVKLNTEIERLNSTIETMKTNIATKESLINQYQEQIAELEAEKEALTTNLASTNEELEKTKTELEDLKFSNKAFLTSQKDELAKVNNKLDLLKTKAKEVLAISEESSAKEELSALVDTEISISVEESIDKITEEIKNNSELSLNIINKLNEVLKVNYDKKIANKVAELEELGTQKDEIEAAKSALENELSVKTAENQAASEELNDLVSKQNDLITEQGNKFDQLISKYKELREQATKLLSNSKNSTQKTELENKLSQIVESEKSKELSTLVVQNNNISDYNIELVELIKELTKANYENQIKDKNAYEVLLNNQLTETQASKDKLVEEVKRLEADNSELKKNQGAKVQELETKLATANEETRKQSALVSEKEKEIQRLSILNSSYSSQISTLQSRIRTLESNKNSLQSELLSVTNERDDWRKKYLEQKNPVVPTPPAPIGSDKIISIPYDLTLNEELNFYPLKRHSEDSPISELEFNSNLETSQNTSDQYLKILLTRIWKYSPKSTIYKYKDISYDLARKITNELSTITFNQKGTKYKKVLKNYNNPYYYEIDLEKRPGTLSTTSIYKSDKEFTIPDWTVDFKRGDRDHNYEDYDFVYTPKTGYIYYQHDREVRYELRTSIFIVMDPNTQKAYVGVKYAFAQIDVFPSMLELSSSELKNKIDTNKLNLGTTYEKNIEETPKSSNYDKRLKDYLTDIKDILLKRVTYRVKPSSKIVKSDTIVLSHISLDGKQ
ncbi:hypothetical protein, partial [Mycoplasma phage sp.]